jgi:hypothetical protein
VTTRRACPASDLDRLTLPELFLFFTGFNRPNVTETGKRVVFTANSNPTGANPMGFVEVFAADLAPDLSGARVRQITDGTDQLLSAGVALDWRGGRLWTWGSSPDLPPPLGQELLRIVMPEP